MRSVPERDLDIAIRSLQPGDSVTGFSAGEGFTALKNFFRKQARPFDDKSLARTYVAVISDKPTKPVAYLTLVAGEIATNGSDSLADDIPDYRYGAFPAVKIARLAVDSRYRGFGLGKMLIQFGMGIVIDNICPAVGCRFLVVDAKMQSIEFYDKQGFRMLDTDENRNRDHPVMFIDLARIAAE